MGSKSEKPHGGVISGDAQPYASCITYESDPGLFGPSRVQTICDRTDSPYRSRHHQSELLDFKVPCPPALLKRLEHEILEVFERPGYYTGCALEDLLKVIPHPSCLRHWIVEALDQLVRTGILERRKWTTSITISPFPPTELVKHFFRPAGQCLQRELDDLASKSPCELAARIRRDIFGKIERYGSPFRRVFLLMHLRYPDEYYAFADEIVDQLLESRQIGHYTVRNEVEVTEWIFVLDESEKLPEWWFDYEPFDAKRYIADRGFLRWARTTRCRYLQSIGLRSYRQKWYQPLGRFPQYRPRYERSAR